MITLKDQKVVVSKDSLLGAEEAAAQGIDLAKARENTLACRVMKAHSKASEKDDLFHISFDALISHDITYVGIIQTARASGLQEFPLPYCLTNCHNSLCAVGGTINEDDHVFGLSAAKKYGGIFVPTNLAVIHQYAREMLAGCGKMILGSDSHTRYGALGCMGVGEGGPELVKQLLSRTYDIPKPEVVLIWLENAPRPGVGPQDVALAIIGAVFKNGFVKNKVMEFAGPGVRNLSVEYRCGIDVMTTETTCLSSIWKTDERVQDYLALHGRKDAYQKLGYDEPAAFDALVKVDLATIEPMIALPFHPSNVYTVKEVQKNAKEIFAGIEKEARAKFGKAAASFSLQDKVTSKGVQVDQGIIAGCAGGSFENITLASHILDGRSTGMDAFSCSLYPASAPVSLALVQNGSYTRLMAAGALLKSAFCGPCFGAGDTPAHGALSIRHTTRNFPNREGSKPGNGQLSGVALMDARSIAATAANGGILTPATELDWEKIHCDLSYSFDQGIYEKRCFNGFGNAHRDEKLVLGPNITDWPAMSPLPEHLVLNVVSVITDPVTTTDELIPSGETSSLRSNPLKLSEFTLSRRDPAYVGRAKDVQARETARLANPADKALYDEIALACAPLKETNPALWEEVFGSGTLDKTGIGSTIFAVKPGDGSAREQAASCQKVLGGWANLAEEYATKRYRSNLINWGMLPFLLEKGMGQGMVPGDVVLVPHVRKAVASNTMDMEGILIHEGKAKALRLSLGSLTEDERTIILDGCLINFYKSGN